MENTRRPGATYFCIDAVMNRVEETDDEETMIDDLRFNCGNFFYNREAAVAKLREVNA